MRLTAREREVHALILKHLPNLAIAKQLGMTPATVAIHKARIYAKLSAPIEPEHITLPADAAPDDAEVEELIAQEPATEWHGPWPHMNEAEREAWTRKLLGPLATPDYYRRDAEHPHKTPLHEISQEGRQKRLGLNGLV